LINVIFKNVGQGDSILIEWNSDNNFHFGIIDCNLYENQNPLLDEIIERDIKEIDFIILSHLHYDHYSGIPDLLQHCITKSIKIKYFLHTFTSDFTRILNLLFFSNKQQEITLKLLQNIEIALKKNLIDTFDNVTINFKSVALSSTIQLSFLAPLGEDYMKLSRQRSHYENKRTTTIPDLNSMSTVICIKNENEKILLTSDATKKTFKRLTKLIDEKVVKLVQVPHHGSNKNLHDLYWTQIKKQKDCPSVYSVGDIKKDKLPNLEVVEFFEKNGFFNTSTNLVYGLLEYYGGSTKTNTGLSLSLSSFSRKKTTVTSSKPSDRFNGDQKFTINL
jgi:beta-lactamase superfamily II metal-dependent hydrolase